MKGDTFSYVGQELATFALASNWKACIARHVRPYLGHHVLEVGAGMGATARALVTSDQRTWTLLEPDPALAAQARESLVTGQLPGHCEVRVGTIRNLREEERFDSILYADVLEHIQHDADEMKEACAHLAPGGHLIVLAPAHQWLFSEFDRSIGHFRRYSRQSLRAVAPSGVRLVRMRYLDTVGILLVLANRMRLRQALPTIGQIVFWDKRLVPISRLLDPLLGFRVGKSVLAVWQREADGPTRARRGEAPTPS